MKNKDIKIEDRPPSGKVPLCERTDLNDDEKNQLVTIDDLYARGRGSIHDSIWAPGNEKLAAQKVAARRAVSAPFKLNIVDKADTMNQPPSTSKPGAGLSSGLGASRFSNNAPVQFSPLPFAVAETTVMSPQIPAISLEQAPSRVSSSLPPHLRGPEPKSQNSLPPHLRGMNKQVSLVGRTNNRQAGVHALNGEGNPAPGIVFSAEIAPPEPNRGKDQAIGAPHTEIQQSAKPMLQNTRRVTSAEDAFMDYMNKKAAADSDAKKATKSQTVLPGAIFTPPTRAPTSSTNNWSQPQPSAPRIGGVRHTHFRVDVESEGTDSFQNFLKKKEQAGVTNGKRYNFAQESTAVPTPKSLQPQIAAQKVRETSQDFLNIKKEQAVAQTLTATQNTVAQESPFKRDPHSAFSPNDLPDSKKVANLILQNADFSSSDGNAISISRNGMAGRAQVVPHRSGPAQSQSKQVTQALMFSSAFTKSAVANSSGGWEMPGFLLKTEVNDSILQEIGAMSGVDNDNGTGPLTEEAMLAAWGVVPRDTSNTFKVSDDGIDAEENEKENVRGTQGRDATEELLDWDKTWLPPPCDWEDRGSFDTGFVPEYIRKDWQPNLVTCLVQFDLSTPDFKYGRSAVNNLKLDPPIVHTDTIPAIEGQENELKRLNQTSEIENIQFLRKQDKLNKISKKLALQAANHMKEFGSFEPPPNPFAPAIEIYLRPAAVSDAAGIADIYNFYVQNSMITEDQAPVSVADFKQLLAHCTTDKLPFILAVKGFLPEEPVSGIRNGRTKIVLPTNETVVGFAFAQAFNIGIGGLRTGRSRTTADVQLYVHSDYTRKGVGRCLLDRILQCLSFAYGAKDGYQWTNPGDDQVYKAGGSEYWHQLIIQIPVRAKQDPPDWLTGFLKKFWFMGDERLRSVGRTAASSFLSEFTDVMLFCHLATAASEFPTTV